ncbi:extracellular solute-binding protein [Scatolibacter rhodanostii]|uniref:extracellular solute-binding protein n=1 Tax=Scatolibacter rhodanostii TaxID=2014781 RepID=UPI000C078818|nr:extracellular solute-binding protein [Scatolibacter rhodanostii]
MKKLLAMLLSAVLVTSVFSACATDNKASENGDSNVSTSETGTTDSVQTYNLAARLSPNWGNPENGEFWKSMEEKTGVKINWTTYLESEADEKFSILMTSGEYPDAFIGGFGGGDSNIITYGSQGVYLPLNDLIEKNAPNFTKRAEEENSQIMNMITAADGNIYALPSVLYNPYIYNNTFINKTWLDKLNLEVPTTTDEFVDVMRAFKENDPNGNGLNDEIPMAFMFKDWGAADHGWYFGAFGYPLAPDPDYTIIDNGKVVYLGAAESFKKGAEWLATLYAEDLLDKEVFTMDDSQYSAKISSDPVSLGVFSSWDNSGTNKDEYVALMPLEGPNGDRNTLKEGIVGFYRDQFIITSACETPDKLIQWVDEFYADAETSLNATMGIGPDKEKSWYFDDNNQIVWNLEQPETYERGQQQLPFAPAIIGEEGRNALKATASEKEEITSQYMEYADKFTSGEWERWPNAFMTSEENEELSILQNDIMTYSKNKLAEWISGEADVNAEWDSYLAELDKIGVSRWVELKQQIYDRFKG